MRLPLVILTFALWILEGANAEDKKKELAPCECDSPACPAQFLGKASRCACLNQAALFCWRRNPQGLCPSPKPDDCGDSSGPKATIASTLATSTSLFSAPYRGESGLNCVEIGYCSRPPRGKTSITITLANGTAIITVPMGLPTQETTPTASSTNEPVIVFTPEARARKAEEVVMTAEPRSMPTPYRQR